MLGLHVRVRVKLICNEVAFPRYSYSYDRTQAGLDSGRVRISSGLALTQLSFLRVFKQAVL
jgi:hypothetical protein